MNKNHDFIYVTPSVKLMELFHEGVLCSSIEDVMESYKGENDFEELF